MKNVAKYGVVLAATSVIASAAPIDLSDVSGAMGDAISGIEAAAVIVIPLALVLFGIKFGARWVKGLVKSLAS